MTVKSLYICFIILVPVFCCAQQPLAIRGIVLNESDSAPEQFVSIFNLRTRMGTISGIEGHFSISAMPGDTIRFTVVGFEDYYFYIDPESYYKDGVEIKLKQANYQLNQVTVTPYMNKEMFRRAFMEVPPDPNKITLSLPPQPEVKELGETTPIPIGIRILTGSISWDPVLNKLRKETKTIDKWKKWESDALIVSSKYNKEVVKKFTNMPDRELEDFMKFCALNNDFILHADDYDIACAIKQCYVAYQDKNCKGAGPELQGGQQ